jgi:hypothetical protein
MKIFYLDVFDPGIEKRPDNGIDIAGHFQTGPGPLSRQKGRMPAIPASRATLDIRDDQNAFNLSSH